MGCTESIECGASVYEPAEVAESFFKKIARPRRRTTYEVNKVAKVAMKTKTRSKELLKDAPTMPRCSSFLRGGCEHCEHFHFLKCCMNPCDTLQYAMGYAEWKVNFEKPAEKVKRKKIARIPEALAGQFTPKGFPGFSDRYPLKVKLRRVVPKKEKFAKLLAWLDKLNVVTIKDETIFKNISNRIRKDFNDYESYYGFNRDFYVNKYCGSVYV